MPSREYHDRLWEEVPEGASGPRQDTRRAFLLAHVSAGDRVLDIGCGEGRFTRALVDAGCETLGIDVAEEPLRRACARDPGLDLRRVEPDAPLPLPDASFDAVWASEVIEHVPDTASWLSEVRRVLRPGGRLLLSTPAHDRLTLMGIALLPGAFARRFDPRGDHLRFYTRRTLRRLLEDFRFVEVRICGVGGVPGARATLLASATRARF
jgi:ubiquinone/menaquinone biosynthesis C-methylase UbiE